jgi:plastocyanin
MDAAGKPDLAIGVRGFAFTPTFIRGTPDQKLTLKLENATTTPHNFSLSSQMIETALAPNSKAEVTVIFPASGVLRFFCSLHAGSGMNGEMLTGDAKPQAVTGQTSPPPKDAYDYQY